MDIETIRNFCLSLPGVTEDMKWGDHLVFSVALKMFVILGLDQTPTTSSFKATDEEFEKLSAMEGLKPAPYMARNKWVWVDDINRFTEEEWKTLLQKSYDTVKAKLPKKTREALEK